VKAYNPVCGMEPRSVECVIEKRTLRVVSKGAMGTKLGLGVPDLCDTSDELLVVLIRIIAQYNTVKD
jgi:hypothetical protein